MVIKVGDMVIIGSEVEAEPAICTDCGRLEELRPYGINAAMVCFDCAMKDEKNAAAMFRKQVKGDS